MQIHKMDPDTELDDHPRRRYATTNFSTDDILVAAIIFLIFCLICLLVWMGSPHLAPRFAVQQQQRNQERREMVFEFMGDDIGVDWMAIVPPGGDMAYDAHEPKRGDIRDRLYDEVEIEENQARQDAGETELDATERLRTAVEEHFREMTQHADDGQNVHDHAVVKGHALKYRRMLELRIKDSEHKEFVNRLVSQGYKIKDIRGMETDQAFREINAYAKTHVLNTERLQRITTVLEEIGRGATSVSLTGRPVKDIWVLTLIWKRIHHRDNEKNKDDMCNILMDQLYDAATGNEGGLLGIIGTGTVCIGGRVGRMMSVLTRMDADEALAKPELDMKELTNEASSKSAQIIKKITEENPSLAILYATLPNELSARQKRDVERFEGKIKKRIDETLRADYKDLLSVHELDRLISNMQSGV